MEHTYGIGVVMMATGASGANIRDWAHYGLLTSTLAPAGRGFVRDYSAENMAEFAVFKQLGRLRHHLTSDEMREAIAMLVDRAGDTVQTRAYRVTDECYVVVEWGKVHARMWGAIETFGPMPKAAP